MLFHVEAKSNELLQVVIIITDSTHQPTLADLSLRKPSLHFLSFNNMPPPEEKLEETFRAACILLRDAKLTETHNVLDVVDLRRRPADQTMVDQAATQLNLAWSAYQDAATTLRRTKKANVEKQSEILRRLKLAATSLQLT